MQPEASEVLEGQQDLKHQGSSHISCALNIVGFLLLMAEVFQLLPFFHRTVSILGVQGENPYFMEGGQESKRRTTERSVSCSAYLSMSPRACFGFQESVFRQMPEPGSEGH